MLHLDGEEEEVTFHQSGGGGGGSGGGGVATAADAGFAVAGFSVAATTAAEGGSAFGAPSAAPWAEAGNAAVGDAVGEGGCGLLGEESEGGGQATLLGMIRTLSSRIHDGVQVTATWVCNCRRDNCCSGL